MKKSLTNKDLAYAAGIIDGEGCVKIFKNDASVVHRPHNQYTLAVQVNMVDKRVVTWLHKKFGGAVYFHPANIKKHPTWRDSWRWYLQNYHCRDFLLQILPFLIIKVKQTRSALNFLDIKKGDIAKKHVAWENMAKLNKVGRVTKQ